jgi:hypothetical protein
MFKIHISEDGQFYYTRCGKNGAIKSTGETMVKKSNVLRAIAAEQKLLIEPLKIVDLTI